MGDKCGFKSRENFTEILYIQMVNWLCTGQNQKEFLAAMSSSRCAVVTQFVFPSVHPSLFLCFRVLGVLSSPKEFQRCLMKVLWKFEVLRVFQGSFKGVYKKIQES